jgi:hypothetical protein
MTSPHSGSDVPDESPAIRKLTAKGDDAKKAWLRASDRLEGGALSRARLMWSAEGKIQIETPDNFLVAY